MFNFCFGIFNIYVGGGILNYQLIAPRQAGVSVIE